jgi:sugar O-acyltransferase (sialic acid O-acetyltransferase NeuD family)
MYILGAGTLGEIILETAIRAGLKVSGFFDDVTEASMCDGIPVLGRLDDFRGNHAAMASGAFVAIGDNQKRKACVESLRALGVHFPNVIDPKATLSPTATLGEGNLVLPGVYIGTKCSVGSCNLIFPGVSITHHNHVGNYCFFSPNASVGGFTRIGDCCKVGMNCVVLPYRELESGMEFAPLTVIEGRLPPVSIEAQGRCAT